MYAPEEAHSWIVYADGSYIATRMLWFVSCQLESSILAQRTVELYLKAYLRSKGVAIRPGSEGWGHRLMMLNEACSVHSLDFSVKSFSRRVGFFDRYFELVRYPSNLDGLRNGLLFFSLF